MELQKFVTWCQGNDSHVAIAMDIAMSLDSLDGPLLEELHLSKSIARSQMGNFKGIVVGVRSALLTKKLITLNGIQGMFPNLPLCW